jgi:methyltransferase-like protein/2-polyprenyl-3-methyl-5-hydroxy-6-metoxy-1,4-benzoquinol methylase
MAEMQTSYDAIPYQSNPFRETRPERLAAVAKLFGLDAPPAENCRVLEIGCSMGGNLVVMAQDHPQSQFIGIDASSRQIAEGWKTIELLGLKNIQLKHLDILDFGQDFGEFDYIISHGVFSWVPPRVQNKMLEICQRHLVPNGVAYISYNTYPGWHIRGIVRDMMLYRGMQFADPAARLTQAKLLVEFVAQATRGADTPYQRLLQSELKHMGQMEDYYLHHDHLEENNHPLYFNEMAKKLAVNGLQYLGEADFSMMVSTNFSPEVAKTLHELGAHDIVQMEQYMDFVRCRYFRKTLICRSSVKLNRTLTPAVVKGLFLASNAVPESTEAALDPAQIVAFQTPGGSKITCRSPLTKVALRTLQREWPMPVAFADLFAQCNAEAAKQGHAAAEANAEEFLAGEMLTCMAAGVVEWRLTPVPFTTSVGETPLTTPLARLQAERGYKVTSLRGETVTLDEIHRQALRQLDGTKNIAEITEALLTSVKAGVLVLHRDGDKTKVTEEVEMRSLLGTALDKVLMNLARMALLARADAKRKPSPQASLAR